MRDGIKSTAERINIARVPPDRDVVKDSPARVCARRASHGRSLDGEMYDFELTPDAKGLLRLDACGAARSHVATRPSPAQ